MFGIKTKKLKPKMTKRELIKSWGKPNYTYIFGSSSREHSKEHWFYDGFHLELSFEDKKLVTGQKIIKKVFSNGRVG